MKQAEKYFIGADLGTSALKLLLVDGTGGIRRTVTREYPVHFPAAGWSEQDPQAWWDAFVSGVRELVAGVDAAGIRGIGLGGQMHGLVVLDREDRVIRPTILWNDGRTDGETEWLNREVGKETLSRLTGNIAFAGFTAPKLLWLRRHEPENFGKISKIMLPKDYVNYRLTGVHCTDYSDASGLLLLDVQNRCWSQEMLDLCHITREQMPRLFESYAPVGALLPQVAAQLGLRPDVVVVAGAGDNAAAAVGTGTVSDGRCNISLGTSGTIFLSAEKFSADPHHALHAFCHADGGYHLMGVVLSAASCNKWFCDQILGSREYDRLQSEISGDNLGRNQVFFLPYLMGERSPINDTDARGTFTGLRMDTSRADMLQAVLEGVAFAIRDSLKVARASGLEVRSSSLCGGGARSALWQKILCNVLGIPITLPQTEQGPGYGAAMLAMVGTGEYPDVAACAGALVSTRAVVEPEAELTARYEVQYRKFQKIYPALRTVFRQLK